MSLISTLSVRRASPRVALIAGLILTVAGPVAAVPSDTRQPAPSNNRPAHTAAVRDPAAAPHAPRFFVANHGQRPDATVLHIGGPGREMTLEPAGVTWIERVAVPDGKTSVATARLRFVGARLGVRPEGREPLPTIVSYFKGPRERWRVGIPTYRRAVYPDLWPGIDLELTATAAGVAHAFRLRPGADPASIRLAWDGAAPRAVDGTVWRLDGAGPAGFDIEGEDRSDVVGPHAPDWSTARRTFDDADSPAAPAAVAPVYAGFFGEAGADRGLGIAVDPAGQAYLTGELTDPATGDTDAFVARVAIDGSGYDYVAVIGGDQYDAGFDVDVDAVGRAVVAGMTLSRAADGFPVTAGPDVTFNGVADAWVARVTADGRDLAFAGYLGGELVDFAEGVRVDARGDVYVHGIALSTQATFPVKIGPDLTFNGETDAFVAKIKAVPDAPAVADNLVYSGYIGGDKSDIIALQDGTYATLSSGQIAVDAAGAVYVSGATTSDEATFPSGDGLTGLPGADRTYAGGWDAYVVKVRPDGSGLAYATYIGGAGQEFGKGMAVDAAGNAYLTGYTQSDEATMPVTVGPDLTFNGGSDDAFVARLRPDGTAFGYLGYLGGAGTDVGEAVAVDGTGRLYVVGYTDSGPDSFPAKDGPDLTQNDAEPGAGDGFVARIVADPAAAAPAANLDFAGYIGGSAREQAYWVALDGAGDAYVVGDTESGADTFPDGDGIGALPGPGRAAGGAGDAFVIKLRTGADTRPPTPTGLATAPPAPTVSPTPPGPGHRPAIYLPAAFHTSPVGSAVLTGATGDPVGAARRHATSAAAGPWARRSAGVGAGAARPPAGVDRLNRGLAQTGGIADALEAAVRSGGEAAGMRHRGGLDQPRQAGDIAGPERSYDDFCDFGIGWAWERTDEHDLRLNIAEDGTCSYRMTQLADGAFVSVSNGHAAAGAFVVEAAVEMQGEDGVTGLTFGVPDDFSRALFYIVTQGGTYGLVKFAGGTTTIVGSGRTTVDSSRPLALAAAVREDTVTLYLGGTALADVPDTSPHAGRVGTYVEWDGTAGSFTAEYDWIRIAEAPGP